MTVNNPNDEFEDIEGGMEKAIESLGRVHIDTLFNYHTDKLDTTVTAKHHYLSAIAKIEDAKQSMQIALATYKLET